MSTTVDLKCLTGDPASKDAVTLGIVAEVPVEKFAVCGMERCGAAQQTKGAVYETKLGLVLDKLTRMEYAMSASASRSAKLEHCLVAAGQGTAASESALGIQSDRTSLGEGVFSSLADSLPNQEFVLQLYKERLSTWESVNPPVSVEHTATLESLLEFVRDGSVGIDALAYIQSERAAAWEQLATQVVSDGVGVTEGLFSIAQDIATVHEMLTAIMAERETAGESLYAFTKSLNLMTESSAILSRLSTLFGEFLSECTASLTIPSENVSPEDVSRTLAWERLRQQEQALSAHGESLFSQERIVSPLSERLVSIVREHIIGGEVVLAVLAEQSALFAVLYGVQSARMALHEILGLGPIVQFSIAQHENLRDTFSSERQVVSEHLAVQIEKESFGLLESLLSNLDSVATRAEQLVSLSQERISELEYALSLLRERENPFEFVKLAESERAGFSESLIPTRTTLSPEVERLVSIAQEHVSLTEELTSLTREIQAIVESLQNISAQRVEQTESLIPTDSSITSESENVTSLVQESSAIYEKLTTVVAQVQIALEKLSSILNELVVKMESLIPLEQTELSQDENLLGVIEQRESISENVSIAEKSLSPEYESLVSFIKERFGQIESLIVQATEQFAALESHLGLLVDKEICGESTGLTARETVSHIESEIPLEASHDSSYEHLWPNVEREFSAQYEQLCGVVEKYRTIFIEFLKFIEGVSVAVQRVVAWESLAQMASKHKAVYERLKTTKKERRSQQEIAGKVLGKTTDDESQQRSRHGAGESTAKTGSGQTKKPSASGTGTARTGSGEAKKLGTQGEGGRR
jgi:hypothetical protein